VIGQLIGGLHGAVAILSAIFAAPAAALALWVGWHLSRKD